MKKIGLCAMFALATLCPAPVMAADNALDTAVELAAVPSVDAQKVSEAAHDAVMDNVAAADVVFSTVIACRSDWSTDQVNSILVGVMTAHQELESHYTANPDAAPAGWVDSDTMLLKLHSAVQTAQESGQLNAGVAKSVMTVLQPSSVEVTAAAVNSVSVGVSSPQASRATSSSSLPVPTPPGSLIPPPPAMSPQQ